MKDEWIDIDEKLPDPGREVIIKWRDGSYSYAYLCNCCKNKFRDYITGGGLIGWPTHWKY